MKRLNLIIDGKEVTVLAEKIAGTLWYHYEGETYSYSPQAQGASGGAGPTASDPSKIQAPMPGKIIKVSCQEGQAVAEGDTLIIMEAMKMEYNLKATQDMKVKVINCSQGDSVALGALLVELEEV